MGRALRPQPLRPRLIGFIALTPAEVEVVPADVNTVGQGGGAAPDAVLATVGGITIACGTSIAGGISIDCAISIACGISIGGGDVPDGIGWFRRTWWLWRVVHAVQCPRRQLAAAR